jgi:hypothetical protein
MNLFLKQIPGQLYKRKFKEKIKNQGSTLKVKNEDP